MKVTELDTRMKELTVYARMLYWSWEWYSPA